MKIQIWGKSKCFDTKKAERYFKERRIPYQAIDLLRYGMSRGELTSVKNAVGLDTMLNPKAADYALCSTWPMSRTRSSGCSKIRPCCRRPSSATAGRPPSAIARMCGRRGNKNGKKPDMALAISGFLLCF